MIVVRERDDEETRDTPEKQRSKTVGMVRNTIAGTSICTERRDLRPYLPVEYLLGIVIECWMSNALDIQSDQSFDNFAVCTSLRPRPRPNSPGYFSIWFVNEPLGVSLD